ncbi:MAG TPA: hypothetical protein VGE08_11185 [Steroidobacter sp.]|uniref:hypothetical protein n=1 Tax=Steroidobacter sp. TaxID=1978227 RepID=UPI002ED8971F
MFYRIASEKYRRTFSHSHARWATAAARAIAKGAMRITRNLPIVRSMFDFCRERSGDPDHYSELWQRLEGARVWGYADAPNARGRGRRRAKVVRQESVFYRQAAGKLTLGGHAGPRFAA